MQVFDFKRVAVQKSLLRWQLYFKTTLIMLITSIRITKPHNLISKYYVVCNRIIL